MADTEFHLCPKYERAVELLGKRWTGLILRVLANGTTSFSAIARAVDRLSDRVLSERLKELEQRGVVQRRVVPSTPVRVEYSLTEKGRDLQTVLDALQAWADRWESPEVEQDCLEMVREHSTS
ncbi:winged helix-turn-helix transcriptional regulator [Kallotenue papyrolyticum]|uniref:winged helix-turn-helix transcriptional regulator n=1 Tax=Kallotenue papyrolyticum TaxID=1325125 RepID=UPI00049233E4|nr:helix-turn-helix domain-containing protein [Kallotenue papyrolyticum]